MKLPIFEMIINPDETSDVEVSFVALVDKPAIEKNFLAFKSQEVCFATIPDKQIIYGPAMVPNTLIYRKDEQGEYNVFFSAQTIQDIALKFFKKEYQKNINLFHNTPIEPGDVVIFQSFISDKAMGIMPMKGYEDLPDGTWFLGAKVESQKVWDMVLSGQVRGFSVEGIFSYVKKEKTMEEQIMEIISETDLNNSHLLKKDIMSDIKTMVAEFKKKFFDVPAVAPVVAPVAPVALATDFPLKDGTVANIDKLEVGGIVLINEVPAPAGDVELADGTILTVGEGGVITAVTPVETAAPAAPDFSAQFAAIDQKFAGYEQRFTDQTVTIQKMAETNGRSNEMLIKLISIVEKLAETPTANPLDQQKSFASDKSITREEKLKTLTENLQKIKN